MLAKDGEHKSVICTYVLTIVIFVFLFSKKKDLSLAWVKNSKVMPQLPCYLSFLLGKGGKPLYLKPYLKTLKYCKVHFLTNPYHALVQISSVCV